VADLVLAAEEAALDQPAPEVVLAILEQLIAQQQMSLVLIGGTNSSLGLGARLSLRVKLPFVNFCKNIRLEDGAVVLTSQLFGGKILSDVRLPGNRGIVSICPGSFPPDAGQTDRAPTVEKVALPSVEPKVAFKRLIEPEAGDIDITKLDVLVSVGRGIQNPDNIPLAEELANALGGGVSSSRPVVDQGWLPLTRQVGKSGMTVKPKLYLALGISGAPEHQEGMKDAPLIIAINTDPKAPIFDIAHYGSTADLFDMIEPLKEAVAKKKAAK
jgi:electron transfer flavoprotein alpha subunit